MCVCVLIMYKKKKTQAQRSNHWYVCMYNLNLNPNPKREKGTQKKGNAYVLERADPPEINYIHGSKEQACERKMQKRYIIYTNEKPRFVEHGDHRRG